MKNLKFIEYLFLFTFILTASLTFADVTDDVKSDTVSIQNDISMPKDTTEPDVSDIIREILQFGIDREVVGMLSELGNSPDDDILRTVLARYESSNLVTTKVDFVKYFTKLQDAPQFVVDRLYQDASDDFVDKQLQVALLSCFGKIGGQREGQYMLRCIDSDDRMISYTASQGLSDMKVPELVPDILARLKESDEDEDRSLNNDIKSRLVLALGQSDTPEVLEYLRATANDIFADKYTVAYAMDSLAKLKDTESIPLMEQNLGHSEVKIQTSAAHSLSLFESPQVVPILNKMLLHNNETVRIYACDGLALNKDKSAVKSLSYKYRRDPSAKVKTAALNALVQMDGEGVAELRSIFEKQKMSSGYLNGLTEAVARYPTSQNVAYLDELFTDAVSKKDKKLIDAVANKIIYCTSNLADPIIDKMLDSDEYLIRMGAIKAIANMKDSTLLPRLQTIADNDSVRVVQDYAKKVLVIKGK
ncbi:MAG: HEAT repeat domain-containing protein [Spirochaetales bacterium]|nr:HEAT repeat domain-containing protein [Spirochaetales bacterium]